MAYDESVEGVAAKQGQTANARVTLREIADRAKVSLMTVSRALRGETSVLPGTRDRILKVAAELQYRPDPLLSALSARRMAIPQRDSYVIPFITNWPKRDDWRKYPHFDLLFRGAERRATEQGYCVEHFWLRDPAYRRGFSRMLVNRGVRGILVAPVKAASGKLALDWEKFVAVKFGYSLKHPSLHYVADHQFHSMRLTYHQLKRRGYKKIGLFISEYNDARAMHQWSAAFLYEDCRAKSPCNMPLTSAGMEPKENKQLFIDWFKKYRPDAIIGVEPLIPEWLSTIKIRVPEQVGFANVDLPNANGEAAGIYQNPLRIGAEAIDFLNMLMRRNEMGIPPSPRALMTHGEWIEGPTVRARPR